MMVVLVVTPAAAQSPTRDAYGGLAGEQVDTASNPQGQVAGDSAGSAGDSAGSAGDSAGSAGVSAGSAGDSAGDSAGVSAGSAGDSAGSAGDSAGSAGDSAGGGLTSRPLATTGQLPFTGLDVGFLAAGSLLLIAMGFGLRQLGRRPA